MNSIIHTAKSTGQLGKYDPKKSHIKISALKAAIKHAAKIMDWPSLWEAIDQQLAEQAAFVAWWEANIQRAGGDRQSKHYIRTDKMLSVKQVEEKTHISAMQVSRWRRRLKDVEKYRQLLFAMAAKQIHGADKLSVHHSSQSPEHYTPKNIVEAVTECLVQIDLDPCSAEKNITGAANHFTQKEDGLKQTWNGTVYMNPPYGNGIGDWVRKLELEYESGNVGEAIALVPARTDTEWFDVLRRHLCCFVKGRLTFIGNDDPAPFPSAVFYLGKNEKKFISIFSKHGRIWRCLNAE